MSSRRRKRPYGEPHPELNVAAVLRGGARVESSRDGRSWTVRSVTSVEKIYTCPGCYRAIPPGVQHVVAYTEDHLFGAGAGVAERRHWHSNCWRSR